MIIDPDVVQYGIPHFIYFGDFDGYKVLVMTKAGPTLLKLLYSTRKQKFNISTICKIAMQAVCIKSLCSKSFGKKFKELTEELLSDKDF